MPQKKRKASKPLPAETIRRGMLPEIIENVALEYAECTGFNMDALAMSMLTIASSVITTNIKVAAYADSNNKFTECLRLWHANVGEAGSGKSPIMKAVMSPLMEIDVKFRKEYDEKLKNHESHSRNAQKTLDRPKRERTTMPDDTSVESAQQAFIDNPDGLLGAYDELVGFFGSISRYRNKSGGGEQTARSFWLSAYDSKEFFMTRIGGREVFCVPSCSILGGIRPDSLHALMHEASRIGSLIERFSVVMMQPSMKDSNMDLDVSYPFVLFEDLIKKMRNECPLRTTGATLQFSPKAALVRDRMFGWVRETVAATRPRNPQLANHISKFSGLFLRFCGVYHMIEHYGDEQARPISTETANKVYMLTTSCLLQHAICFYSHVDQE